MTLFLLDDDAPLLEEHGDLLGVLEKELVDRRLRASLRTIRVSPSIVVEDDVSAPLDEPHGVQRVGSDRVTTVIAVDKGKIEAFVRKARKNVLTQTFMDRHSRGELGRVGPEALLGRSIHEVIESWDLRHRRLGVLDEGVDPDQGPCRAEKLLEKESRSLTFENADLKEPEILFSLQAWTEFGENVRRKPVGRVLGHAGL